MKRHNFVANSSSSSFLLVGHKVTIEDVLANPDENYMCLGGEFDARDVFEFTTAYARLVKKFGWDGYTIVRCVEYICEGNGVLVEEGPVMVWRGEVDYYVTDSVKSFVDKYIELYEEEKPRRVTVGTFEELDEVFIHEVMVYLDGLQERDIKMRAAISCIMVDFYGVNKEMAADLLRHWIIKGE